MFNGTVKTERRLNSERKLQTVAQTVWMSGDPYVTKVKRRRPGELNNDNG
jgi:hypothetical protein